MADGTQLVFLVLAHRLAGQAIRLIRRLDPDQNRVLVHVDSASSVYGELRAGLPDSVEFLPRVRVRWGGYGMTAAALVGLRAALTHPFGHVVLLSGQDYPIKPLERISIESRELGERSLLKHEPYPVESWRAGGFDRIYYHHSARFKRRVRRVRQRLPGRLQPYGGPQWWTLSRSAAAALVGEIDRNRSLERFYRTSLLPEESLPHTVLLNSLLAPSVINRSSTLALWTLGESHPATLSTENLPRLREAPEWFARKFDETTYPGLLDLVDQQLL
jgi:hypothetical protein